MLVKQKEENGNTYYVNALTGKREEIRRVLYRRKANPTHERNTAPKAEMQFRGKTKQEKLREKKAVRLGAVKKGLKKFREGKKDFNKEQFILDCRRANLKASKVLHSMAV